MPQPPSTNLFVIQQVTENNQTIFHTEDALHHVLATFPPDYNLNAIEPNGLIHISRFAPATYYAHFYQGYTTSTGQIIVPPDYDAAGPYAANGLAEVHKDGHAGFVDMDGKLRIPMDFLDVGRFGANGLAPAMTAAGWGYIDTHGDFVIAPQFAGAKMFGDNGWAPVEKDDLWGYIDHTGAFVIPPRFDDAGPFDLSGIATVKHRGRDLTYATKTFGLWTVKATIYAVPETMMMGPHIRGIVELTGHSRDGRVNWTVSTLGFTLLVKTEIGTPAVTTREAELDDFPADDKAVTDLLAGETGMSAVNKADAEGAADLADTKAELLSAIAAMHDLSNELYGKLTGPIPSCLPPSCMY